MSYSRAWINAHNCCAFYKLEFTVIQKLCFLCENVQASAPEVGSKKNKYLTCTLSLLPCFPCTWYLVSSLALLGSHKRSIYHTMAKQQISQVPAPVASGHRWPNMMGAHGNIFVLENWSISRVTLCWNTKKLWHDIEPMICISLI